MPRRQRSGRSAFTVLADESSPDREQPEEAKAPTQQLQKMKIGPATVPEVKKPVSKEGRRTIVVETNLYRHIIEPKTIYRYDVGMSLHTMNGHVVDLLFKGNNNADITNRPKLCMSLMKVALESHKIVSDGEYVIHDGAACLYSTEDLTDKLRKHSSILQVNFEDVPTAVGSQNVHAQNARYFAVEIGICREMPTLNTADYVEAQTNREFDQLDRTFKQFMDLLTSQDALMNERFMSMRQGKLYLAEGPHQNLHCGHERVKGVDKGIKFISDGNGGVIPALTIDSKQGDFFKSQRLKNNIEELLEYLGHRGRNFPFDTTMQYVHGTNTKMANKYWDAANKFVRGLQMERIGSESRQCNFIAVGITKMPISAVKEDMARSDVKQPVLARFREHAIDTTWPAVMFRGIEVESGAQVAFHYPMELLTVKVGQRVPIAKQVVDPTGAVRPQERFRDIYNMLHVLNLDQGAKNNELMKGFGITIEENPITTEALIRDKPQVQYQGRSARIEDQGNWRSGGMRFLVPADLTTVYVLGGRDDLIKSVINELQKASNDRGLNIPNWIPKKFYERNSKDTYVRLEALFKEIKSNGQAQKSMVILVDDDRLNTHGVLKLAERRFQVRTMHMIPKTANSLFKSRVTCANIVNKINEKCGGVNHTVNPDKYGKMEWIKSTMFIGYDVSHPTGESRDQKMNRAPPKTPSTIGFSFNGGKDMSAFLGDFHYQKPLQERVESSILTARTKWMLDLFIKNRGCAPKAVYIIRDGVSEGQYAMVMKEEFRAIKAAFTDYKNQKKLSFMPKFQLYVSTKRHNVKFVQMQTKENLPAGSFISRDITRNDLPEFYMLAHKVIKGTGNAPSIQCLIDENKTTQEQDQSIFHALAYCHKIVDSPVSNAEPVYMADEYAKRGKNLFNAYSEHHNFPMLSDYNKEEYREAPIDFEKLTGNLAYWKTTLEEYRVNA